MGNKAAARHLAKGLRVPDKNLHLALLDEIQSSARWLHEREAEYEAARGSHPTWPTWAVVRERDQVHNTALEQYLLECELDPAALAKIVDLRLDGDRRTYSWVHPTWWEESDVFAIADLRGLEHCQKLETLHLGRRLVQGASLRPLTSLTSLGELSLSAASGYRDIDALLTMPSLRKLEIADLQESSEREAWEQTCAALTEAGLKALIRS